MKYKTQYIIQPSDVGRTGNMPVTEECTCCGSIIQHYPFQPLGVVIPTDVGKMIKRVGGLWYAESEEQFKKRKGGR